MSTMLPDDGIRKQIEELFEEVTTWAGHNVAQSTDVLQLDDLIAMLESDKLLGGTDPKMAKDGQIGSGL